MWPLTSFPDHHTYSVHCVQCGLSYCFEQFCWKWTCLGDLLSDGRHKQPLNEVVEALVPNILVQFLSLHNTLFNCLQFVQLQLISLRCPLIYNHAYNRS